MFAQRAAAVHHGFAVDDHNADTINRIVTALEGVPLAIELAAARIRLLPPRRNPSTPRPEPGLPLRRSPRPFQSVSVHFRATLNWSYDLLADSDRELFSRMAIFSGSFSLAAAEAVGAGPDGLDLLEGLTSLVNKSLIEGRKTSDREPPISHVDDDAEITRNEQLDKSGVLSATAQRHAEYYRDLSRQVGTIVRRPRTKPTRVDWLSHGTGTGDIDNVRVAMRWYLTHDQPDAVADILWSLWLLGWISGRLVECRGWAGQALSNDSELTELAHARLLTVAGLLDMWLGDYDSSLPALHQGVINGARVGRRRCAR